MVRLPAPLRPLFPFLKPAYTRVTRAAAPVTQRMSRLRGGYLPTGVVGSMEEAARSTKGRCMVARPAERVVQPPSVGLPPGNPLLGLESVRLIPRVAVAELPSGRVLGDKRAVITGNGDLLQELSQYFGTTRPSEHPLFLHPFPPPPVEFEGRLGVLASRGDANYYHFLLDVLPRLGVLELVPQIAPPDKWYVPSGSAFQRELLLRLGLTDADLVDSTRITHIRAQTLVVPGVPAMHLLNPPWVTTFLRGRLLQGAPMTRGRYPIYVTRGATPNSRAVVNEQELLASLSQRGFRTVDPGKLTVAEQIAAFASASLIVAPHGAALTNIVFCSPGAVVVELFPSGELLPDCFRTLATNVPGVDYRYLISRRGTSRPSLEAALVQDIQVDVPALLHLLDDVDRTVGRPC